MDDRWFILLLAGGIGLVVYLALLFLGEFEPFCKSFSEYNKKHSWLRPDNVSYERTIVFIAGIVFYFAIDGQIAYFFAILFLVLGSVGDAIDGLIARITGSVSTFGQWLDPFLDKFSYLLMLTVFAYQGYLYFYLHLVTVLVEMVLGQFVVRYILLNRGKSVAAIWIGKIKAVSFFLLLFICDLVKFEDIDAEYAHMLQVICLILAVLSAVFKLRPPSSFFRR